MPDVVEGVGGSVQISMSPLSGANPGPESRRSRDLGVSSL